MKNNCLAYNLKYLRKVYHLSQSELAGIVGKTYSAVSLWERELREPSDADIQGFCKHFGLRPADLMYRRLDEQVKATPQEREQELVLLTRLMTDEQYTKVLNYAVAVLTESNDDLTLEDLLEGDDNASL